MARWGGESFWVLGVLALGVVRCGGNTAATAEQGSGGSSAGGGSGGSSAGGGRGGSSGVGGSLAGGRGGGSSGGSGGVIDFDGSAATGGDDSGGCAATSFPHEPHPVALYVMLDQSLDMTKLLPNYASLWQSTAEGIGAYLIDPRAKGSFGIQYFGHPTDTCNIAEYATADVAIGELPGVASAVVSSLAGHSPQGSTPTGPALQGALQYAGGWAGQHPFHRTVVVLLTAGFPDECDPQPMMAIAEYASAARRSAYGVNTYVIGIGALPSYDVVAQAGGSGKAILLGDSSASVRHAVTDALLGIAADQFGCVIQLPPPPGHESIDLDKINVQFQPEGGGSRTLAHVSSEADCGTVSEGWYYDHSVEPAEIVICPDACVAFDGGSLDVVIGCPTVNGP